MTKKIVKRGLLASGLVIGALALSANAQPGERMFERMAQKLNLTAEQQTSVREIQAEYGVDRDGMLAKRAEVKALVDSGEVDAAADLAATHAREAVYRRVQMRDALSEVLTPEQMTQMQAMMEKRLERRERGQRGRQRGFRGGDDTAGL